MDESEWMELDILLYDGRGQLSDSFLNHTITKYAERTESPVFTPYGRMHWHILGRFNGMQPYKHLFTWYYPPTAHTPREA